MPANLRGTEPASTGVARPASSGTIITIARAKRTKRSRAWENALWEATRYSSFYRGILPRTQNTCAEGGRLTPSERPASIARATLGRRPYHSVKCDAFEQLG